MAVALPKTRFKGWDADVERLCAAVDADRLRLRVFRENRREAVRAYAGNRWSANATRERVPLNLLAVYVQIVGRNLVSKDPRVRFATFEEALRRAAAVCQDWANDRLQEMGIGDVLRRIAVDALFSVGIGKVALARPADAALAGFAVRAGTPYVSWVDLDDFVYETNAHDFSQAGYMGHRYRVPLAAVRGDRAFGPHRKEVPATDLRYFNPSGDERIQMLGRGYLGSTEEVEDYTDLWEIYLPRSKRVLTLASDDGGNPVADYGPLIDQEWVGPDCGPYYPLGFGYAPGFAMPKAPIMDLLDLHDANNTLWTKLIRQGERQKTHTVVGNSAADDGIRINETPDGHTVRLDQPQLVQTVVHGGPHQGNFLLAQETQKLFDFMGGGLALLGGRAAQSRTLGQDRMLNENASAGVSDMQETMVAYTARLFRGLAWYFWYDPFTTMKAQFRVASDPGPGIVRSLSARDRAQARFAGLRVNVDPYSLVHRSPTEVLAALDDTVRNVIIPAMPLLQQQGVAFDVQEYLKKKAVLLDLPELTEIVTVGGLPEQPEQGGGPGQPAGPGKPGETTRNYVRRSAGQGSPAAEGQTTRAHLLGMMSAGEANGSLNKTGA